MRDYADVLLELNHAIKRLHAAKLKQNHVDSYLIACDVTDLAMELEDTLQKDANIQ
jgi:hypothetical protein